MKLAIIVFIAFGAVASASRNQEFRKMWKGKHHWHEHNKDKMMEEKHEMKEEKEDKDLMMKQKFILEVTKDPSKPMMNDESKSMEMTKLVYDDSMFKEFDEEMNNFFKKWPKGLIAPREGSFNMFNRNHMKQTMGLFKIFYYAKDWESFEKMVLWARMNVNEQMFIYALNMAMFHRKDMKFLTMPSYEEIFPQYFFDEQFISKAKMFDMDMWIMENMHDKQKMEMMKSMKEMMDMDKDNMKDQMKFSPFGKDWGLMDSDSKWWEMKWNMMDENKIMRNNASEMMEPKWMEMMKDMKMFWMKADFNKGAKMMNEESKLAYLTDDPAWNMYWMYMNMEYPPQMKAEELGLEKARRGERWLYNIQQILARYYQERLSQGMGKIPEFTWSKAIKMGYNPDITMPNGLGFTMRPNYYHMGLMNKNYQMMEMMEDLERRMRDVIAFGSYKMADGTSFDLRKPESIEMIGNMMQGNMDSLDRKFFGVWSLFAPLAVSGADMDMYNDFRQMMNLAPNVMMHMETMMKDPLFYMMYKRIANMYFNSKYFMGPYEKKDLYFDGIKIKDMSIDELKTFFSWSDSDVTALMNNKNMDKDGNKMMLMGRRDRLNHKPFNFKLGVDTSKDQQVVIRLFLGPKYDEMGREMDIKMSSRDFIELDQFVAQLKSGMNEIKRNSDDFYWYRKDFTTSSEMYKKVMMGLEGKMEYNMDYDMQMSRMSAFPDRLMLPKGWVDGMPMKMFVMVSPFEGSMKEFSFEEQMMSYRNGFDNRAFGYPLDRKIDEANFWTPNMLMKDVMIFHSKKMM